MKEKDHIHCKRASDILEVIGGYLMPLDSVKNFFHIAYMSLLSL